MSEVVAVDLKNLQDLSNLRVSTLLKQHEQRAVGSKVTGQAAWLAALSYCEKTFATHRIGFRKIHTSRQVSPE